MSVFMRSWVARSPLKQRQASQARISLMSRWCRRVLVPEPSFSSLRKVRMCPRSRFAHLPLIIDLTKSHRKPRWKRTTRNQSARSSWRTSSNPRCQKSRRSKICTGNILDGRCIAHLQQCACAWDEAIAEFNGFKWVQVHATGLARPNVLSAWFKIFAAHTFETELQCVWKVRGRGRRVVPGGAISQLTHSGTRCPWRAGIGEWLGSPHMRHDGHYSVPREQCLGCPQL